MELNGRKCKGKVQVAELRENAHRNISYKLAIPDRALVK